MRSRERGFSIVEVLVALLLTAIAFSGIVMTAVTAMRANAKGQRVSAATGLARAKLEKLRTISHSDTAWTVGTPVEPQLNGAGVVAAPGIFTRRWTVEPNWDNRPRLSRVTVVVAWQDAIERSVTLSSLYWDRPAPFRAASTWSRRPPPPAVSSSAGHRCRVIPRPSSAVPMRW
jgi:type II secretory pathway pseudopilin PulG